MDHRWIHSLVGGHRRDQKGDYTPQLDRLADDLRGCRVGAVRLDDATDELIAVLAHEDGRVHVSPSDADTHVIHNFGTGVAGIQFSPQPDVGSKTRLHAQACSD